MRRTLGLVAAATVVAGCGGGNGKELTTTLPQSTAHLRVSSPAFINGARLRKKYTCDGAGDEPVVRAGTVPPSTRELVLVVSDPDAPKGTFVHVTRYGLSPRDGAVNSGGVEGDNSAGKAGWTPPCPPKGDAPHHYVWTVFALRSPTDLKSGADPEQVVNALSDGALASGAITATYSRPG
ncbi:MAG: YbhB/YbcL family Raf kinase inhibitor-like protein [Actinobacteria bacterium]|nr:MAG: YbhB/YbcL family Raf kinase inhibitor-like protein [Actinomycetota bacterium]